MTIIDRVIIIKHFHFQIDDEASNFKTNLIQDYINHCKNILWKNDNVREKSTKTVPKPIMLDFTRQFVKHSKVTLKNL